MRVRGVPSNIRIPQILLNVPLGMFFYLLGYKLQKAQYNKIILILSIITFVSVLFLNPSFVDFRSDSTIYGNWTMFVIGSIAGIIIFNNIFKFKFLQLPEIVSIGQNSITYYCMHWILFEILEMVFRFNNNDKVANYTELYVLVLSAILILPITAYWRNLVLQKHKSR